MRIVHVRVEVQKELVWEALDCKDGINSLGNPQNMWVCSYN